MGLTNLFRQILATQIRFFLSLLFSLMASGLYADNLKPLLINGKANLYQRVVTLPGAEFYQSAEISISEAINVPPFSVYYVYQRITDSNNASWLQLGFGRYGNLAGWVMEEKTLQWNQGLTLIFRSPADHDRVLLFKDRDSLKQMVTDYDLSGYNRLYNAAINETEMTDSPVVAIQPDTELDIKTNFYLLPIQDYEDVYLQDKRAKLLKISSIPVQNSVTERKPNPSVDSNSSYTADIAFVIDATLSMQPYINRTREAIQKVFDTLKANDLLGDVRFALVAYRDNTDVVPGLEYLVRTFVTLEQGQDPKTFVRSVKSLRAARTTSQNFVEDSYAGIQHALKDLNWLPNAARYIILITDAGPRQPSDPLSMTGLDAGQLNKLAQEKDVATFVLHLLTPSDQADHDSASLRYQQLSDYPDIGSLYYSVPAGDIQEFGVVIDTLANQITSQLQQFNANQPLPADGPTKNARLSELREKVLKLGYALRLKYLQSRTGEPAPDVFDAWLLDRDFKQPDRSTIDVCVLLTRDQLSDLHGILQQVLQTAEQGLLSPQNFLGELKSLAATVSRDPGQLGITTAITQDSGHSLADMGYLREYMEDLPYSGEVMNLDLDDWQSWNTAQQIEFLHKLEDKIGYYKALHDHADLWIALDGGPIDGSAVYPIPLNMLP